MQLECSYDTVYDDKTDMEEMKLQVDSVSMVSADVKSMEALYTLPATELNDVGVVFVGVRGSGINPLLCKKKKKWGLCPLPPNYYIKNLLTNLLEAQTPKISGDTAPITHKESSTFNSFHLGAFASRLCYVLSI